MQDQEAYSMFEPPEDGSLLTKRYPELGRMKEFRQLKKHEQIFVWHYACVISPSYKAFPYDTNSRAKRSFEIAFKNMEASGATHQQYVSLRFPDHIKVAVARMEKFNPDRRARALAALEQAYETCLEVLSLPLPGFIGETDEAGDNGEPNVVYVDVTPAMIGQIIAAKQKAREELPGIINQLEEGFGIIVQESEKSGMNANQQFIRDQKLTSN